MADIVGLLQEGVGNLLRHAGLELMHLVMDEEVKSLAGERHQQYEQRRAHRWGKEDGYCVVDGQKVPIKRTRLRTGDHPGRRRARRSGAHGKAETFASSASVSSLQASILLRRKSRPECRNLEIRTEKIYHGFMAGKRLRHQVWYQNLVPNMALPGPSRGDRGRTAIKKGRSRRNRPSVVCVFSSLACGTVYQIGK
jgi:hypothetical protein